MKLAAHVLPCFDNEVRWQRPHRTRAPRSRRKTTWHEWQDGALGLQCRLCFRLAEGPRAEVRMDGCSGPPVFLKRLLDDSKGHQLVAIAGTAAREFGGSLESCRSASQEQIMCIRCGGWPQCRGIKLGRFCEPPHSSRSRGVGGFSAGPLPQPQGSSCDRSSCADLQASPCHRPPDPRPTDCSSNEFFGCRDGPLPRTANGCISRTNSSQGADCCCSIQGLNFCFQEVASRFLLGFCFFNHVLFLLSRA